jgi:hypothetical protein
MMAVLGQVIEAGDENASRQIFDVFDTLLITVRPMLLCDGQILTLDHRRRPFCRSMSHNWYSFYFSVPGTVPFQRKSGI